MDHVHRALHTDHDRPAPAGGAGTPVILLAGRHIPYTLRRSARRRTLALQVDERGLLVAAPLRAPQRAIDALLLEHAAWVLRKYDDWLRRRPAPRRWCTGEPVMLYGETLTLAARDGIGRPVRDGSVLWFGPECLPAAAVEARIRVWLREQALDCFTHWCRQFSARLAVAMPTVRLSNARTRWGSCHAGGRIRMNWRLVQAPQDWIEYVAAHEVAHLREMNHSPAFWQLVAQLVPDYAARRAALRRQAHRYLLV